MIKWGCLGLAALMLLGVVAFKQADIPKTLSCAGDVPVPTSLGGVRFARALGELVARGSEDNWDTKGETARVTRGMWSMIGIWGQSFVAAAKGEAPPAAVQQYETEYAKAQREHADGCGRCATVAGQGTDQGLGATGGYSDPVDGGVGAHFGETGSWARYHTGLDFRARMGTPVKAVSAGRVVYADDDGSWAGRHVAVQHSDGVTTMYSHLSEISVTVGRQVAAGTVLGKVGETGRAFGPHLHFEVYPAGVKPGDVYKAVDPTPWLKQLRANQSSTSTLTMAAAGKWNGEQRGLAATAVAVARQRGLPDRAVEIILATGLVESGMQQQRYLTVGSGDRDSQGWLQQRSSSGWGTTTQLRSAEYQAGRFYDKLVTIPKWQTRDPGAVAQAIQVSAHPERYGKRLADARNLFQSVSNQPPGQQAPREQGGTTGRSTPTQPDGQGEVVPELPQPEACTSDPNVQAPGNYTAGGVRTITDPTSNVTYRIPIPAGPAGRAINFALDQVGEPYKFNTQGPDTWDCSGLVSQAWAAAGVPGVPPQTEAMLSLPTVAGPAQPGDLLRKPGHVQMYLMSLPSGKDLVVEAPRTGLTVRIVPQWMKPTDTFRPGERR